MVQRVVTGALPGGGYGLRVSKPGFNVLDPGLAPNQVSFDSRVPRSLKVLVSGSVFVPVATGAFQYVTVNFAAQPYIPVCLVWMTGASGDFSNPNAVRFIDQSLIGFSTGWTTEATYAGCKIFNDRLQFLRYFNNSEGAYTANYIVLSGL